VEQEQTPAAAIQAMNRLLEADPYLRATGQVGRPHPQLVELGVCTLRT
jgi:hypothetical protein